MKQQDEVNPWPATWLVLLHVLRTAPPSESPSSSTQVSGPDQREKKQ
jgi:hypothetical protein